MKIQIMTLDIGNLYQELDKHFCISPRTKKNLYTHCIVEKPMRLLVVNDLEHHTEDMLKTILDHLNERMLLVDGFFCGKDDPLIWLIDPSSVILYKREIPFGYIISDYSRFIISYTDVSAQHVDIPEEWESIICVM